MIKLIKRHLVMIIVAIVVLGGIFYMKKEEPLDVQTEADFEQAIELVDEEFEAEQLDTSIIVDIKGEVQKPGVYEVDQYVRVSDAISIAGGFTEDADQTNMNLAQRVHDEMVIIVPKEGEEIISVSTPGETTTTDEDRNKIRINQATLEEIQTLNGIGPKKAQAIIDYREEHGSFQSVEDLIEVNGIGEKTVENMKESIIVP
ncbi:helix-hairpin-helix domain-containing protein [Pseudogracilibacillus auburnensis]|uniref:helix-hairpin-helix domain-containing protein n=1 Tax=Pseudogracilibacillus auburnensis TaxID=1494959 RepID=UPI001F61A113|nr:helix-hairpin-helix domain-containing protein [Pseudogracilibacillus auburnensis]